MRQVWDQKKYFNSSQFTELLAYVFVPRIIFKPKQLHKPELKLYSIKTLHSPKKITAKDLSIPVQVKYMQTMSKLREYSYPNHIC